MLSYKFNNNKPFFLNRIPKIFKTKRSDYNRLSISECEILLLVNFIFKTIDGNPAVSLKYNEIFHVYHSGKLINDLNNIINTADISTNLKELISAQKQELLFLYENFVANSIKLGI